MYNNHFSLNKQKCRDLVEEQVSNLKGEVNVFTLPSTNFILEKQLLTKSGVKVYCAENDTWVYRLQRKQDTSKLLNLKKGDAFDIIKKSKQKFNVIWLDLCSPLRHKTINSILSLVQSDNLAEECYLNITFACARESNYTRLISFYGATNLKQFRDKTFPNLVKQFSNSVDKQCKLVKTINYKEQGHAIPMKMLTFKIQ